MRVRRGWSPVRMIVAGFAMILIGASLGVWVSSQRADPVPTPEELAVGGGDPAEAPSVLPTADTAASAAVIRTPTGASEPPEPTRAPTVPPAATATATPTEPPATARATATAARPTATPTDTPEPTATPDPTFDTSAEPECAISAETATVGQPLTMECTGFLPESQVRIYWEGISASRTSFEASGSGAGEATFPVPEVEAGRWYARASDGEGRSATVRLSTVAPALALDPIIGQRESELTVELAGFGSGEEVALRWYGVDGSDYSTLRTPTVGEDGSARVELTVPNGASGRHRLAAVGLTTGTVVETIYRVIDPGEPVDFFQGTTGCNRIALIFNVGIGNPADPGVMETLRREDVPATMFVMGWWPERFPESFQQIVDGGFVIGNHGYNAIDLTATGDDAIRRDLEAAEAAITAAMGRPPARWFTPYAGTIDDRVRALIAAEGYVPVGWRVNTEDWNAATTADDVYNRVVDGAYDGAIVEFHLDGPTTGSSTGAALPRIIETLRDRGYEFVTVPELAAPCGTPASGVPAETALVGGPHASLPPAARRMSRSFVAGRRRSPHRCRVSAVARG